METNKMLVEKWDDLLSAKGNNIKPIEEREMKAIVAQLLENQEQWLGENQNVAGDLGVFTPILVPTVRRIIPALVANQLVGVQPMSGPTGYAFAWRASYAGTGANPIANAVNPLHRGGQTADNAQFKSVIILVPAASSIVLGENVLATSGGTVQGVVKYVETTADEQFKAVLVDLAFSGDPIGPTAPFAVDTPCFFQAEDTSRNVSSIINNEAMFNLVLRNYTGPMSTAAGEVLGDDGGTDNFPSMRVSMERQSVEAETRKLKAEYTMEMAQDLKSVHNMDAEAELMNVLQYEIAAEVDRALIHAINTNAATVTNWAYGAYSPGYPGSSAVTGNADGQWEQEKMRTLYTKIIKEANRIAVTTRRGTGNFLVASPNVVGALEGLNNFMYSPVSNDLGPIGSVTKVGMLDGRFAVYLDTFATSDYVTIGYKGASNLDTGVVFCPYIPLMMQKITHEKTFQPAIGVLTRSAIMYNMMGTNNYYRKFAVDFTGSQFGGDTLTDIYAG